MLTLIVAALCFLACGTALGALAAGRAAAAWSRDLGASATVQVRPRGSESPSEAAERAAEALAGAPGVVEARALDRAAAEKLLEPWLGAGNLPEDLPVPRLVVVDLDPRRPATPEALSRVLAAAGVDAAVDDHAVWLRDVRRTLDGVRLAAALALLVFAGAAAAIVVFATRATLQARREVIEVLHIAGAEDAYLAGLVQRRFALLVGEAAAVGAALAAALGALAIAAGPPTGLIPVLPLAWSDLLWLLLCPLAAALLAAVAVRGAAMSILRAV